MVDVMPTDASILGFGNEWYREALRNSSSTILPNGIEIRHVTAPYFVATKIEAFHDRGQGDYLASHDFEDLISVVDGRLTIEVELIRCPAALRNFVATRFSEFLADRKFHEALPGVVLDAGDSPSRTTLIIEKMNTMLRGVK